ncbi:MAG: hypothetical protein ACM3JI_03510 [Anaerolineae bacterium]
MDKDFTDAFEASLKIGKGKCMAETREEKQAEESQESSSCYVKSILKRNKRLSDLVVIHEIFKRPFS